MIRFRGSFSCVIIILFTNHFVGAICGDLFTLGSGFHSGQARTAFPRAQIKQDVPSLCMLKLRSKIGTDIDQFNKTDVIRGQTRTPKVNVYV